MEHRTLEKSNTAIVPEAEHESSESFDVSILSGQLAPSTIAMYRRDFDAYLEFAAEFAMAVRPATLARWRAHLAQHTTKSPNTINRMLSAVKRLMREAALQGFIPSETANAFGLIPGVKVAALKDRVRPNNRVRIDPQGMREICDSPESTDLIGLRDTALLATLASSGLRVSELAELTIAQIKAHGDSYIVLVRGKNDVTERQAPLSREAYAHICRWVAARPVKSGYIFTAFDGRGQRVSSRPLSTVSVWKIVKKYADANGLHDVKPHDFRRFVGTQLAKDNLRMAQKALGHKRLETTAQHYVLDELEPGLTDDLY